VLAYLLLQDCSDMGVGRISGQGEDCSGEGVSQGNFGDEGRFGNGESGFHVGCPWESFYVT
jgi:hypothetical protein